MINTTTREIIVYFAVAGVLAFFGYFCLQVGELKQAIHSQNTEQGQLDLRNKVDTLYGTFGSPENAIRYLQGLQNYASKK